jgi:hypothetical protein
MNCQLCSDYSLEILNKAFGNQPREATTSVTWKDKKYEVCAKCKKMVDELKKGEK